MSCKFQAFYYFSFFLHLEWYRFKRQLTIGRFMKSVATITLSCFLLNILATSGYATLMDDKRKKDILTTMSVSGNHGALSPAEMAKDGGLIKVEDKDSKKTYLIDKRSKEVVGFVDQKSGNTTRFTKDENGRTLIRVYDVKGREVTDGEKEKQVKRSPSTSIFGNVSSFLQKAGKIFENIGHAIAKGKRENDETRQAEIKTEKNKLHVYSIAEEKLEESAVTVKALRTALEGVAGFIGKARTAATMMMVNLVKQFFAKTRVDEQAKDNEVSMQDIMDAAKAQGVTLYASAAGKSDTATIQQALAAGPVIAHLGDKTKGVFVVLTSMTKDKVSYIGPDGRPESLTIDQFQAQFSGNMLTLKNPENLTSLDQRARETTKGTFARLVDTIKDFFSLSKNESTSQVTAQTTSGTGTTGTTASATTTSATTPATTGTQTTVSDAAYKAVLNTKVGGWFRRTTIGNLLKAAERKSSGGIFGRLFSRLSRSNAESRLVNLIAGGKLSDDALKVLAGNKNSRVAKTASRALEMIGKGVSKSEACKVAGLLDKAENGKGGLINKIFRTGRYAAIKELNNITGDSKTSNAVLEAIVGSSNTALKNKAQGVLTGRQQAQSTSTSSTTSTSASTSGTTTTQGTSTQTNAQSTTQTNTTSTMSEQQILNQTVSRWGGFHLFGHHFFSHRSTVGSLLKQAESKGWGSSRAASQLVNYVASGKANKEKLELLSKSKNERVATAAKRMLEMTGKGESKESAGKIVRLLDRAEHGSSLSRWLAKRALNKIIEDSKTSNAVLEAIAGSSNVALKNKAQGVLTGRSQAASTSSTTSTSASTSGTTTGTSTTGTTASATTTSATTPATTGTQTTVSDAAYKAVLNTKVGGWFRRTTIGNLLKAAERKSSGGLFGKLFSRLSRSNAESRLVNLIAGGKLSDDALKVLAGSKNSRVAKTASRALEMIGKGVSKAEACKVAGLLDKAEHGKGGLFSRLLKSGKYSAIKQLEAIVNDANTSNAVLEAIAGSSNTALKNKAQGVLTGRSQAQSTSTASSGATTSASTSQAAQTSQPLNNNQLSQTVAANPQVEKLIAQAEGTDVTAKRGFRRAYRITRTGGWFSNIRRASGGWLRHVRRTSGIQQVSSVHRGGIFGRLAKAVIGKGISRWILRAENKHKGIFNKAKRVVAEKMLLNMINNADTDTATLERLANCKNEKVAAAAKKALASRAPPATTATAATAEQSASAQQTNTSQSQATTDAEKQEASTKAINTVEQKLNEFVNADPARKAQIAAELGVPLDKLADLSAEKAQQIIAYLKSQGTNIINCAVEALKNVFTGQGINANLGEVAGKAILIDIITGNLQVNSSNGYDASQLQLSMYAIQKTAELYGVKMTGYSTDMNGLAQAANGTGGAIAHLNAGDGQGHFVVVTNVSNGQVTYTDSDGSKRTVSQEEFQKQWSGNVLSQKEVSGQKTTRLQMSQLQEIKGAGFFRRIARAVSRAVRSVTRAVSGAVRSVTHAVTNTIKNAWDTVNQFRKDVWNATVNVVKKAAELYLKVMFVWNPVNKVLIGSMPPWMAKAFMGPAAFIADKHEVKNILEDAQKSARRFWNSGIGKIVAIGVGVALSFIPVVGWIAAAVWTAFTTYGATGSWKAALIAGVAAAAGSYLAGSIPIPGGGDVAGQSVGQAVSQAGTQAASGGISGTIGATVSAVLTNSSTALVQAAVKAGTFSVQTLIANGVSGIVTSLAISGTRYLMQRALYSDKELQELGLSKSFGWKEAVIGGLAGGVASTVVSAAMTKLDLKRFTQSYVDFASTDKLLTTASKYAGAAVLSTALTVGIKGAIISGFDHDMADQYWKSAKTDGLADMAGNISGTIAGQQLGTSIIQGYVEENGSYTDENGTVWKPENVSDLRMVAPGTIEMQSGTAYYKTDYGTLEVGFKGWNTPNGNIQLVNGDKTDKCTALSTAQGTFLAVGLNSTNAGNGDNNGVVTAARIFNWDGRGGLSELTGTSSMSSLSNDDTLRLCLARTEEKNPWTIEVRYKDQKVTEAASGANGTVYRIDATRLLMLDVSRNVSEVTGTVQLGRSGDIVSEYDSKLGRQDYLVVTDALKSRINTSADRLAITSLLPGDSNSMVALAGGYVVTLDAGYKVQTLCTSNINVTIKSLTMTYVVNNNGQLQHYIYNGSQTDDNGFVTAYHNASFNEKGEYAGEGTYTLNGTRVEKDGKEHHYNNLTIGFDKTTNRQILISGSDSIDSLMTTYRNAIYDDKGKLVRGSYILNGDQVGQDDKVHHYSNFSVSIDARGRQVLNGTDVVDKLTTSYQNALFNDKGKLIGGSYTLNGQQADKDNRMHMYDDFTVSADSKGRQILDGTDTVGKLTTQYRKALFDESGRLVRGSYVLNGERIDEKGERHIYNKYSIAIDAKTGNQIINGTEKYNGKSTYYSNARFNAATGRLISGKYTTTETLDTNAGALVISTKYSSIAGKDPVMDVDAKLNGKAISNANHVYTLKNGDRVVVFARNAQGNNGPIFKGLYDSKDVSMANNGSLSIRGMLHRIGDLDIYGSLTITKDGAMTENYSAIRGTIDGKKVDQVAKNGVFTGRFNGETLNYRIKSITETGIIAEVLLNKGDTLRGVSVVERAGQGGPSSSESSFKEEYKVGITQDSQGHWNFTNLGEKIVGVNVKFSLASAARGTINSIDFVSLPKGTLVVANSALTCTVVGGTTVSKDGVTITTKDTGMSVDKGTRIEIRNEGGIYSNAQYSSNGKVSILESYTIREGRTAYNGTRTLRYLNGKVTVDLGVSKTGRVNISNGRYIDLQSVDFKITSYAEQMSKDVIRQGLSNGQLERTSNGLYRVTSRIEYRDAQGNRKWLEEGSLLSQSGGVVKNTNFRENVAKPILNSAPVKWFTKHISNPIANWAGKAYTRVIKPVSKTIADYSSKVYNRYIVPAGQRIAEVGGKVYDRVLAPVGQRIAAVSSVAYEKVLVPTGHAIAQVADIAYDELLVPAGQIIAEGASAIYNNALVPAGQLVVDAGNKAYDLLAPIGQQLATIGKTAYDTVLAPAGRKIYDNVLVPAGKLLTDAGQLVYENILVPAGQKLTEAGNWINENVINPAATYVSDNLVKPMKDVYENMAAWMNNNIINPLGLQPAMQVLGAIATVATAIAMPLAIPALLAYTDTGRAITAWMATNWKGALTSAAVGAGGGAAVGSAFAGVGAIPGAIVGGLVGLGSYVLGNITSGGKAGGFTGDQIVDGLICGVVGALSVFGVAGLGTTLASTSITTASKVIGAGKSLINLAFVTSSELSASHSIMNGNYLGAALDAAMAFAFILKPLQVAAKIAEPASEIARGTAELGSVSSKVSIGERAISGLKTAPFVGGLSALSSVASTITDNISQHKPVFDGITLQSVGRAAVLGALAGMVIGAASPKLANAWTSRNIMGTMERYRLTPLMAEGGLISTSLQTGRDLALFNASPFGAGFNYAMAKLQGGDFGWKEYTDSISNGFAFGLLVGPLFSMAIPGEAMGTADGAFNRFTTRWAKDGPLSAFTGGKATAFMPSSWYAKMENSMLGHQIKMIEMVAQYQVAGQVMGSIGNGLDRLFGTKVFGPFLSEFSFFLVPTRMGASTGMVRAMSEINGTRGIFGLGKNSPNAERLSFADQITSTEPGRSLEVEGKNIKLTAEEVGQLRKSAFLAQGEILVKEGKQGEIQEKIAQVKEGETTRYQLDMKDGNGQPVEICLSPELGTALNIAGARSLIDSGKVTVSDLVSGKYGIGQEVKGVTLTGDMLRLVTLEHMRTIDRDQLHALEVTSREHMDATGEQGEYKPLRAALEIVNDTANKQETLLKAQDVERRLQQGRLSDVEKVEEWQMVTNDEGSSKYLKEIAEKRTRELSQQLLDPNGESFVSNLKEGLNSKSEILKGLAESLYKQFSEKSDTLKAECEKLETELASLKTEAQADPAAIRVAEANLQRRQAESSLFDSLVLAVKTDARISTKSLTDLAREAVKARFEYEREGFEAKNYEKGSRAYELARGLADSVRKEARGVNKLGFGELFGIVNSSVDRLAHLEMAVQLETKIAEEAKKAKEEVSNGPADTKARAAEAVVREFNDLFSLVTSEGYLKGNGKAKNDVQEGIKTFLKEATDRYWKQLDEAFISQGISLSDLTGTFDPARSAELRDKICEKAFGKTEKQLNVAQKLILDLKIAEKILQNKGYLKEEDKITEGTKTPNQIEMLVNNLLGRVSALETAAGKTFTFMYSADLYFHLMGPGVAEFLAAKATDAGQFVGIHNKELSNALGIETTSAREIYAAQKFSQLAELYNDITDPGVAGRIISYDLQTRGFVELQARMGKDNGMLDNALNKASFRVADEADVAALSRVSFVLGSGNIFASRELVNHIETILNSEAVSNAKVLSDNTKDTDYTYTKEGDKFIFSKPLEKALENLRDELKDSGYTPDQIDAQIDNGFRAKYVMEMAKEGKESIQFSRDGNPVTIENGVERANTTDQSASYNVALVLLEMANIKAAYGEKAEAELAKRNMSRENIKLSQSIGESTISQIFSRGRGRTLNCGGSATLDVAKEIAHVIFGGEAVEIQSSRIADVAKPDAQGKMHFGTRGMTEQEIINKGIEDAVVFLENGGILQNGTVKRDATGTNIGLVFGAMDARYLGRVLTGALERLAVKNGVKAEEFALAVEKIRSETATLTGIRDGLVERFTVLKQFADSIQIIDARLSGSNPEAATAMAARKGMLTFSNESGLRGMDFKSIDITLLDGHNFSESDLLQAVGRAGRNTSEYDDFLRTVYFDSASMAKSLEKMRQADEFLMSKGRRLFEEEPGKIGDQGKALSDILWKNADAITSKEFLEISSRYKSLSMKSESILFKAYHEAMYILVKEPVAALVLEARRQGKEDVARYLEKSYQRIIEHAESKLRGESESQGLKDGASIMKETFDNILMQAKRELSLVSEGLKDSGLKREIDMHLLDLERFDESTFKSLQEQVGKDSHAFDNETFAQTSRSASEGASPVTSVAKILLRLSQFVLPGEQLRANSRVMLGEAMAKAEQQIGKEGAEALRSTFEGSQSGETNTGRESLTYKSPAGETMLTARGVGYMNLVIGIASGINANNSNDRREIYSNLSNFFGYMNVSIALPQAELADAENMQRAIGVADFLMKNDYTLQTVQDIGRMAEMAKSLGVSLDVGEVQKAAQTKLPKEVQYHISQGNIPALPSAVVIAMASIILKTLGNSVGNGQAKALKNMLASIVKPYETILARIEESKVPQSGLAKVGGTLSSVVNNPVKAIDKATNPSINSLLKIAAMEGAVSPVEIMYALSGLTPVGLTMQDVAELIAFQKSNNKLMNVFGTMSIIEFAKFKNSSSAERILIVEKKLGIESRDSGKAVDDLEQLVQSGLTIQEAVWVASPKLASQIPMATKGTSVQTTLQDLEKTLATQSGAAALQSLMQTRALTRAFTPEEQSRERLASSVLVRLESLLSVFAVDKAEQIMPYLRIQGGNIINCAVQALTEMARPANGILSNPVLESLTVSAYLSDIVAGRFAAGTVTPQLSMQAVIAAAAQQGIPLNARTLLSEGETINPQAITVEQTDVLKQELPKLVIPQGSKVVAHLYNQETDQGHYVVITGIENDKVRIAGEKEPVAVDKLVDNYKEGFRFTGYLLVDNKTDELNTSGVQQTDLKLADNEQPALLKAAAVTSQGGSLAVAENAILVKGGVQLAKVNDLDLGTIKGSALFPGSAITEENMPINWSKDVEKTLSDQVFSIMKPADVNVAVWAALQVCPSVNDLYGKLGISAEKVAGGNISTAEIITGYMQQADNVLQLAKNGEFNLNQVDVQLAILKTVKDMLLVLNGNDPAAGQLKAILAKDEITPKEVALISTWITGSSKKVNQMAVAWIQAQKKAGGKETVRVDLKVLDVTTIDVAGLRSAVEGKRSIGWLGEVWQVVTAKINGEATLEDKMKDVLGSDFRMDASISRNGGVRLMDPLSMKAVSGSA